MTTPSNVKASPKLHKDRYVLLCGSLCFLFWNLSLFYIENPMAEIALCFFALILGVRAWLLFSRKFIDPIDSKLDRYVETAIIMIYFVTGLIQTFDGHFPDRFRVITYAVVGLVIGLNLNAYYRSQKKKL